MGPTHIWAEVKLEIYLLWALKAGPFYSPNSVSMNKKKYFSK